MPVLMVGAGLFLAGSKSGQAVTQKASDVAADVSGQVMRQARNLGDQLQESASATNAYAGDQLDRVTAAVSAGREQVKESADDTGAAIASGSKRLRDGVESAGGALSERASGLKNDGLRMAGSAAATVQDLAAGATAAGRSAISNLADSGLDAARAVRHKASDASDRAGKTVLQTIERNSLLVAGFGLLVGGLIASALPRSDFEDDLVGDTSSAAKRRAQATAAKGFETAKAAAGDIYDEAARQAEAEGLTADGLGKAAQDITQRVRRVAEAAVTTAFEPSEQDHQPNAHGDHEHG